MKKHLCVMFSSLFPFESYDNCVIGFNKHVVQRFLSFILTLIAMGWDVFLLLVKVACSSV